MTSRRGCNLHPLNGSCFQVPVCRPCVFFREVFLCVFARGLIGLFAFLLLSFESCLYILDANTLLDAWLTNIFSRL